MARAFHSALGPANERPFPASNPLGSLWLDPMPGNGERLYDVPACGVNYATTHHRLSGN